ncbi:uncharacterized protein LOC111103454 [Crassostrea virginica]
MKTFIFFCHLFVLTDTNLCMRDDVLVCCPGFVFNSIENRCTPCEDGYFGFNCRDRCPAPYFGKGCALQCDCSKEQCHHVYGCRMLHEHEDDTTTLSKNLTESNTTKDTNGTEFHQQTIGISKGFVLNFSEVVIISVVALGIVLVITSIVIVVLITKGSLSLGR